MIAAEALADAHASGDPAQLAGAGAGAGVAESIAVLELGRITDEFGAMGVQTGRRATTPSMSSTAMRRLSIRWIGVLGLLGEEQTW
ncbi:hypothetical protein ACFXPV_23895 [Streptomyces sp. NPDC059118]|uniref:hypothetical protein n=1 Tax=unclassified Streptomyces TaxID=2593676 RepID=UPI003695A571